MDGYEETLNNIIKEKAKLKQEIEYKNEIIKVLAKRLADDSDEEYIDDVINWAHHIAAHELKED